MGDSILLLSRCLRKSISKNSLPLSTAFHFKGYYKGRKIKEISIRHGVEFDFEIKEDYLLWVRFLALEEQVLICSPLKVKKI